jgi:hypothetical protein
MTALASRTDPEQKGDVEAEQVRGAERPPRSCLPGFSGGSTMISFDGAFGQVAVAHAKRYRVSGHSN